MGKTPRPPDTWLKASDVENGDVLIILQEPKLESPHESKFRTTSLIIACMQG